MKIKRLKVENLYGYIDKDLNFNSDITLLVGINGSGKTSILNIINWIISPSLAHLCVTDFKALSLWFTFNDKDYEINCKHIGSTFQYKVKTKGKNYAPLVVLLNRPPQDIQNNEVLRSQLIESYKTLRPDEKEKRTWELVSTFPSPTIIGLDRNLYTEESDENIYFDDEIKSRVVRKKTSLKSPLDRVKDLINLEYRKRKTGY